MSSSIKPPSQESYDSRSIDVVTYQMAMQQELESLRCSLAAKSKKLDTITTAFRNLEDKLEDQYHAYDALRKRYSSRKRTLNAVLKKFIQLQDQQTEGQVSSTSRTDLICSPQDGREAVITNSAPNASAASTPFFWGLIAGICISLLLTGIGMFWWGSDLLIQRLLPPLTQSPTAKQVSESAVAETKAIEKTDIKMAALLAPGPTTPSTLRDRYRDGAAGPLMAVIPPGEFTMGTRGFLPGSGEHPAHRVQLSGFLIGVNEVTFNEYDRFVRATGCRSPDDSGWGRGHRPVVDVSWSDARDYTQWLSRQTGRRYRLPSEAEWEYAARAGTESAYWWGHDLEPGNALCFGCGSTWSNRSSAPVGSFAANPLGLNDPAGNVLEWVRDCYHPSYQGAPADGQTREDGPCTERVARGGAFNTPSKSLRSSARQRFAPDTRINMIGFRLARDS